MPIRELKADLQRRGVPCEDCFEKTDLVDRFLSASPHPGAVVSRDQRLSALVDVNAGSGSVLQIFRFHASWSVSKGLLIVHNLLFPESARPHEPIPLILDTGADACVVSPEVAHKFGAKPTGQTVEGWDPFGVVVASDLIHFGPITAGPQPLPAQFMAMVHDVRLEVAGLLGTAFLVDFDLVLDFRRTMGVLYPAGSCSRNRSITGHMRPVPILPQPDQLHPVPLVEVHVTHNGRDIAISGVLDSGADRSLMNWQAAEALGLTRGSPLPYGAPVTGWWGTQWPTKVVEVRIGIGRGDPDPAPCQAYISDLVVPGDVQRPYIYVGLDVLDAKGVLLLSLKDRMVWL